MGLGDLVFRYPVTTFFIGFGILHQMWWDIQKNKALVPEDKPHPITKVRILCIVSFG